MQENYTANSEDENENEAGAGEQEVNPVSDCGIVSIKNAEHSIHILTIIGQVVSIDSVKYSTRFPCRSPF
jgi:hypothetical protein